jgi:hypothetical protein
MGDIGLGFMQGRNNATDTAQETDWQFSCRSCTMLQHSMSETNCCLR